MIAFRLYCEDDCFVLLMWPILKYDALEAPLLVAVATRFSPYYRNSSAMERARL